MECPAKGTAHAMTMRCAEYDLCLMYHQRDVMFT